MFEVGWPSGLRRGVANPLRIKTPRAGSNPVPTAQISGILVRWPSNIKEDQIPFVLFAAGQFIKEESRLKGIKEECFVVRLATVFRVERKGLV